MDIYEVLYTTRAMRRLKPDPIPYDAQARILDAAIRAPEHRARGGDFSWWMMQRSSLSSRRSTGRDLKRLIGGVRRRAL